MDDEKLIRLVEINRELYDVFHPKYVDSEQRRLIWQHISDELDVEVERCKRRWQNIRDNYRKSLKKGIQGRYRYNKLLTFLNEHFHTKDPLELVTAAKDEDFDVTTEYLEDYDTTTENNDGENYQQNDESIGETKVDISQYNMTSYVDKKTPKRKRIESEATSVSSKKHTPKDSSSTSSSTVANAEAVDAFLAGLAPTLKTLSPYYLNLAKTKIFTIVQEYELEMILEKQKPSSTSDNNDN